MKLEKLDNKIIKFTYQIVINLYNKHSNDVIDDIVGDCLLYYAKQKQTKFKNFKTKKHFLNWYAIKCKYIGIDYLRNNGRYNSRWKGKWDQPRATLLSDFPKDPLYNIRDEHTPFHLTKHLLEQSSKTLGDRSRRAIEYYFIPEKMPDVKDMTSQNRGCLKYNVLDRVTPVIKHNLKVLKEFGITE